MEIFDIELIFKSYICNKRTEGSCNVQRDTLVIRELKLVVMFRDRDALVIKELKIVVMFREIHL